LYACIQASKLWYKKLKRFLLAFIDDILVIAEKQKLERLKAAFLKDFWWITMAVGNSHSYIGI
jgi:hypothetical protein